MSLMSELRYVHKQQLRVGPIARTGNLARSMRESALALRLRQMWKWARCDRPGFGIITPAANTCAHDFGFMPHTEFLVIHYGALGAKIRPTSASDHEIELTSDARMYGGF